jgi:hypothetical protein
VAWLAGEGKGGAGGTKMGMTTWTPGAFVDTESK